MANDHTITERIMKHPKHREFFKEFGYVVLSGPESKTHNIKPKATLMLPIGMSDHDLVEKFNQWEEGVKC